MKVRGTADAHQFDANGNLVLPEELTDEEKVVAESMVLHHEGVSPNHPSDVAAQYVEADEPPPIGDDGQPNPDDEAYQARKQERTQKMNDLQNAQERKKAEAEAAEAADDTVDDDVETDEEEANNDPSPAIRPTPDAPDPSRLPPQGFGQTTRTPRRTR
jgi:hypothetical protein